MAFDRESEKLEAFRKEWVSDTDYVIAHTSGSTGKPKEIHLAKEKMKSSAWRTIRFFGLNLSSYLYSCVSSDFVGGKMMAVRGWELGCRLEFETPSINPLDGKDFAADEKIDLISVVPSQMLSLLRRPDIRAHISRFLIGGAQISESLRKGIVDSGVEAWESYGMTETCSHIALRPVTLPQEPFRTLPGVEVSLDDRNCLVIMVDGDCFVTNDIAEITSDGGFFIKGRIDNVIVTGGKKLNPELTERKLEEWLGHHYSIAEGSYAISSLPDEKWGERCVLAVAGNAALPDIEDLKQSGILENWENPKQIVRVQSLPVTPNGKINRAGLRELLRLL